MNKKMDPVERSSKDPNIKRTDPQDFLDGRALIRRTLEIEAEKNSQIMKLNDEVAKLEKDVAEYRNSSSWRITRPLRQVKEFFRTTRRYLAGAPEGSSDSENFSSNMQLTRLESVAESDEKRITEDEVYKIQSLAMTAMAQRDWQSSLSHWEKITPTNFANNISILDNLQYANAGQTLCGWAISPSDFLAQMQKVGRNSAVGEDSDTVVYSAIAGGYDNPWPYPPTPKCDYVRFSDVKNAQTWGFWDDRPLPFFGATSSYTSRWVKLHPHFLFAGPRWAVWHDSNILLLDGWDKLLIDFQNSGLPMGAIPHPHRSSSHEEIEACLRLGKATPEILAEEYSRLGPDPQIGLWETGVCFFDLRHPQLPKILSAWWRMIEEGTHRDQIYLPYALSTCGSQVFSILQPGGTVRSDHRFGYVPHNSVEFERIFSQISSSY